jgi:hypothetical protein
MRVIASEREHYEVHEVPYGKVYSWRPERTVLECDCGERLVRVGRATACACGAVHTEPSRYRGGPVGEEHPWTEEYEQWRRERDAKNLRREYFAFVEAASGV